MRTGVVSDSARIACIHLHGMYVRVVSAVVYVRCEWQCMNSVYSPSWYVRMYVVSGARIHIECMVYVVSAWCVSAWYVRTYVVSAWYHML